MREQQNASLLKRFNKAVLETLRAQEQSFERHMQFMLDKIDCRENGRVALALEVSAILFPPSQNGTTVTIRRVLASNARLSRRRWRVCIRMLQCKTDH